MTELEPFEEEVEKSFDVFCKPILNAADVIIENIVTKIIFHILNKGWKPDEDPTKYYMRKKGRDIYLGLENNNGIELCELKYNFRPAYIFVPESEEINNLNNIIEKIIDKKYNLIKNWISHLGMLYFYEKISAEDDFTFHYRYFCRVIERIFDGEGEKQCGLGNINELLTYIALYPKIMTSEDVPPIISLWRSLEIKIEKIPVPELDYRTSVCGEIIKVLLQPTRFNEMYVQTMIETFRDDIEYNMITSKKKIIMAQKDLIQNVLEINVMAEMQKLKLHIDLCGIVGCDRFIQPIEDAKKTHIELTEKLESGDRILATIKSKLDTVADFLRELKCEIVRV